MPNFAYNELRLYGKQSELDKFLAPLMVNGEGYAKKSFLETFVPMPEKIDGMKECDEHNKRSYGDAKDCYLKYNPQEDWYHWQMNHWGVKWGDIYEEEVSCSKVTRHKKNVLLQYYTPWSPALKGILSVSELFPSVRIVNKASEYGNCWKHRFEVRNGKVLVDIAKDWNHR